MFGSRNFLFAKTAVDGGVILFMWGNNDTGQLGRNNTTNYSSPVQVGFSTTWSKISVGAKQTLAVNEDGELWAWGLNSYGSLGLGDTNNRSSPTQVGALTNWAIPFCGYRMSLCIKTDNTLWSWGRNGNGQLGHGNTTSRSSPVQVGSSTTWAAVTKGIYNTNAVLAVTNDGKLFAWGSNPVGQLGLGDTDSRSSPVQVGLLTNWKTPTTSSNSSGCTTTDGKLFTWGQSNFGQLGLGNVTNYSSPVQVGALTNWATISITGGNAYAFTACVKTDGTLFTWGGNSQGTLGQNNTIYRSSPVQVGALTNWAIPTTSQRSVMCSKTDGTLWAWGGNNYGQLGQGNSVNRSSPVQIGFSDNWLNISSGSNERGATKEGPTAPPVSASAPVVSGVAEDFETLTSTRGTWNNDPYSFTFQWQRGTSNIGGATSSTYQIQTADVGSTLRCVVTATNGLGSTPAASANTAVVTATAKKLYGWGRNQQSNFGIPGYIYRSSPVFVGGSAWENLAVAKFGGLCTKTDGTLWSWGTGTYGQPGQGNTSNRSFPQQIGALTNWSKPSIGGATYRNGGPVACVKTDGTLWTWGYNNGGVLGQGNTANRSSPTQVGALTTWANISVCFSAALGVTTSGTLFGWGSNYINAHSPAANYSSPKQVGALTNWSKSQAFRNHALHVKTDNTLWANGTNSNGQFGNGNTTSSPSPVQIGSTVWATPMVGGAAAYFSACIRTDGTLWTWGRNSSGQLGLGDTDNRSSPVQVGALTTWSKVVGGLNFMGATKTDGTLWAWGNNDYGRLALGDTTSRSSPVQVGALTNWANPAFGIDFGMCTTT